MKLKAGNEALYKHRHDEIWSEMTELMLRKGTRNFSIYRHGLTLFAYQESDPASAEPDEIDPIVWKWWKEMAPLMETNPDNSPVSELLEEMFFFSGNNA
jgi:L-rhamnose mutarotase